MMTTLRVRCAQKKGPNQGHCVAGRRCLSVPNCWERDRPSWLSRPLLLRQRLLRSGPPNHHLLPLNNHHHRSLRVKKTNTGRDPKHKRHNSMLRSAVLKSNGTSKEEESSPITAAREGGGAGVTFLRRSTSTQSLDSVASCCSSSLGVGTFAALDLEQDSYSGDNMMSSTSSSRGRAAIAYNDDLDNLVAVDDRMEAEDADLLHAGQHPSLRTVCVMDCVSEQRIVPNANAPFCLDNECFTGTVMLLMRTPDVDNPRDAAVLGPVQQNVSEYFRGKKRRFEFQFQIRLKRVPTGALFLGCELEHSIKVGTLTKGLVNILLAMVRRINPGFHYSWGSSSSSGTVGTAGEGGGVNHHHKLTPNQLATGDYEKTHLSFPVEASMDRIVITKPGEAPPVLGKELHETAESVKRRRKMGAGSVDWNTSDTYTMCLWSAYADWIKWKSINVPGVSPFSLSRVTGAQPIYLSVYEITSCASADYKRLRPPHAQKDLHVYTRLEFSNDEKTFGGLAEKMVVGGRRRSVLCASSDQSLPDTESVGSDLETLSRVSHITN